MALFYLGMLPFIEAHIKKAKYYADPTHVWLLVYLKGPGYKPRIGHLYPDWLVLPLWPSSDLPR